MGVIVLARQCPSPSGDPLGAGPSPGLHLCQSLHLRCAAWGIRESSSASMYLSSGMPRARLAHVAPTPGSKAVLSCLSHACCQLPCAGLAGLPGAGDGVGRSVPSPSRPASSLLAEKLRLDLLQGTGEGEAVGSARRHGARPSGGDMPGGRLHAPQSIKEPLRRLLPSPRPMDKLSQAAPALCSSPVCALRVLARAEAELGAWSWWPEPCGDESSASCLGELEAAPLAVFAFTPW